MAMIGDHLKSSVLAFDPGGTTGIARLDAVWVTVDDQKVFGRVVYTYALEAEPFFHFLSDHENWPGEVVCEASPKWSHHNPVTMKVEELIRQMYSDATMVQPSQWKKHPSSLCPERLRTRHEKDVVRLARWFLARRITRAESRSQSKSTRTHSARTRHQRH